MKKQLKMASGIVALMFITLNSFAQVSHGNGSNDTAKENNEKRIVKEYLDIVFTGHDQGKGLERILSDNFDFVDPMTKSFGGGAFITMVQSWITVPKTYKMERQIVEGNTLVSFYTIVIILPNGRTGNFEQVDYVEFDGNKISKERTYLYDPLAFAQFMGVKTYIDRYKASSH